jgi:hypothetical protein
MVIKINLRSTTLMLALILVLMSTNAVVIAQEGGDTEINRIPLLTRTPVQYDGDISSGDRSPIIPGGPGFVSIHPSAFSPLNSSSVYGFYSISEIYNSGTNPGYYLAPVNLPHNATFTKLVAYFFDQANDAKNITVELFQCDFGYNGCAVNTPMGSVVTTYQAGNSHYGYVETTSFTPTEVNLQSFSYVLRLTIPGGLGELLSLVNVRVDYGYDPIYFPSVNN